MTALRGRGEVQPIRDEMELLESERRILSPGCCTEEREKGEGGRREGEEEGDHASCNTTVSFREEEKSRQDRGRRERERRPCVDRNNTWDKDEDVLLRTDGGRAQREPRKERERERNGVKDEAAS